MSMGIYSLQYAKGQTGGLYAESRQALCKLEINLVEAFGVCLLTLHPAR